MKPYGPDRPGFEAKFVFPSSTDKKKHSKANHKNALARQNAKNCTTMVRK